MDHGSSPDLRSFFPHLACVEVDMSEGKAVNSRYLHPPVMINMIGRKWVRRK